MRMFFMDGPLYAGRFNTYLQYCNHYTFMIVQNYNEYFLIAYPLSTVHKIAEQYAHIVGTFVRNRTTFCVARLLAVDGHLAAHFVCWHCGLQA